MVHRYRIGTTSIYEEIMKRILWSLFVLAILVGVLFIPLRLKAQIPSITVEWTATGDDSLAGTASLYQLRRSTVKPDTTSLAAMNAWWNAANICTGLPIPAVSGTKQSTVVVPNSGPAFSPGTYYFVIKICDEVPNCSPYSNVASIVVAQMDVTPPARIIDLFVR